MSDRYRRHNKVCESRVRVIKLTGSGCHMTSTFTCFSNFLVGKWGGWVWRQPPGRL